MSKEKEATLLVGDNPFHGISHLSQERSRLRDDSTTQAENAANLIMISVNNGADGFMFSVSNTTLSILKKIREREEIEQLELYAIVPYAYEYVRLATQSGGMVGLAGKLVKQVVGSGNVKAMAMGLKGFLATDPVALMKAYLLYEISRIRSAAGKEAKISSVLLHEIIIDMALALDLDWFVKSYVHFVTGLGIKPGFETRNFVYLANKFSEWNIDFEKITIVTPFNKIGFQMNPSKTECEKALERVSGSEVIAMSIFAAGYLKPTEAIDYFRGLQGVDGVVVGVSKEQQAAETFKLLR